MNLYDIQIWIATKNWFELFLLMFSGVCDIAILLLLLKIIKLIEKKGQ